MNTMRHFLVISSLLFRNPVNDATEYARLIKKKNETLEPMMEYYKIIDFLLQQK